MLYYVILVGMLTTPQGQYVDHHVQTEQVQTKEECLAMQGVKRDTYQGNDVTLVIMCKEVKNPNEKSI